jgi:hypothetical protein
MEKLGILARIPNKAKPLGRVAAPIEFALCSGQVSCSFKVQLQFIHSASTSQSGLEEHGSVGRKRNQMKKENRMNMDVRKYLGTSFLSVALLLASGIPALAKNARTVTFGHDFVLNGTTVPAGRCSVQWETHSPEATIEFVKHHKVVLSTEGRVEERSQGYNRDEVVYNTASDGTMSLVEIHFAYSNKVLVFNQETPELKAAR